MINRGLTGLLQNHPLGVALIPFDRSRIGLSAAGLTRFGSFLADLRRQKFDLTVDLQGLLRSGIMSAATGSPVRVGLDGAREGARHFYTHRIRSLPDRTHAVDKLMDVAGAFGGSRIPKFSVAITQEDVDWGNREVGPSTRPVLVLNAGARWLTKRWPPSAFAEVARHAARERGATLVIVGPPKIALSWTR